MTNFTQSELSEQDIVFNNEHRPESEAFIVELSETDNSWGDNFQLWVNGELSATFRSFNGLRRRADTLIRDNDLVRA